MRHREIDVAHACRHQLRQRVLVRRLLAQLLLTDEAPEAFRRQRCQQTVGVAEVVRGRGVADPCPLGDTTEGKALDAALGKLGLSGRQQHGREV